MVSTLVFGDYEALHLMPGSWVYRGKPPVPLSDSAANVLGRSYITDKAVLLKVGRTPARVASLSVEEHILCSLVGVPGVPQVLWSKIVPQHAVIVIDTYGPTIETLYDQANRRLELDVILSLGDQLLSRLEFIHSRLISHGNLTPYQISVGEESWKSYQVSITDFEYAKKTNELSSIWPAQKADLKSVGAILVYLLGTSLSWPEFQATIQEQGLPRDVEIPATILAFLDSLETSTNSPDYSNLRRILHHPFEYLSQQGPCLGNNQSPESPASLYDRLHSQLAKSGDNATFPLDHEQRLLLVKSLSKVLDLYMNIFLLRKSTRKQVLLLKAYDLPSRLWRDLRWYLAAVEGTPLEFQKDIVATVYGFMAAMVDVIPCYKLNWLENLITLADKRWKLETGNSKREALTAAKWRWQELHNALKAEASSMASP